AQPAHTLCRALAPFFLHAPAAPHIYPLSLHDALPICLGEAVLFWDGESYQVSPSEAGLTDFAPRNDRELLLLQLLRKHSDRVCRSEEHTSELQSLTNLVCRLLLEKKKTHHPHNTPTLP